MATKQHFKDLAEFQAVTARIPIVEETSVKVYGEVFPRYKAIGEPDAKRPITIVGQGFTVIQHRDALTEVSQVLQKEDLQPDGFVQETDGGMMTAVINFRNPHFVSEHILGINPMGHPLMLGIRISNSYGEPSSAFRATASAHNEQTGANYIFPALASRAMRHIGDVNPTVHNVMHDMAQNAPMLGRRIKEAIAFEFAKKSDIESALRGLGYGDRTLKRLMDKPNMEAGVNAWRVFDTVSLHITLMDAQETYKEKHHHAAYALLDPESIAELVAKGHELNIQKDLEKNQKLQLEQ